MSFDNQKIEPRPSDAENDRSGRARARVCFLVRQSAMTCICTLLNSSIIAALKGSIPRDAHTATIRESFLDLLEICCWEKLWLPHRSSLSQAPLRERRATAYHAQFDHQSAYEDPFGYSMKVGFAGPGRRGRMLHLWIYMAHRTPKEAMICVSSIEVGGSEGRRGDDGRRSSILVLRN